MLPVPRNLNEDAAPCAEPTIVRIDLAVIRRDGGTQGRVTLNASVINEYAEKMRSGVDFPPVRVWFDGRTYWLSDGFQRISAAELIGTCQILAEVSLGTLEDAKWDSYAANSSHGVRRTRADIEAIMERALLHVKGLALSNSQVARHVGVAEATIRRWRTRASSTSDKDTLRVASRNGKTYAMQTGNIGKNAQRRQKAPRRFERLQADFNNIRQLASPVARRFFVICGNWVFEDAPATVCLDRVEALLREIDDSSARRRSARHSA
jgi:hypothetical protein